MGFYLSMLSVMVLWKEIQIGKNCHNAEEIKIPNPCVPSIEFEETKHYKLMWSSSSTL